MKNFITLTLSSLLVLLFSSCSVKKAPEVNEPITPPKQKTSSSSTTKKSTYKPKKKTYTSTKKKSTYKPKKTYVKPKSEQSYLDKIAKQDTSKPKI